MPIVANAGGDCYAILVVCSAPFDRSLVGGRRLPVLPGLV